MSDESLSDDDDDKMKSSDTKLSVQGLVSSSKDGTQDRIDNDEVIEWFNAADMDEDVIHTPFGTLPREDVYGSSTSDDSSDEEKAEINEKTDKKVVDWGSASLPTAEGWGSAPPSTVEGWGQTPRNAPQQRRSTGGWDRIPRGTVYRGGILPSRTIRNSSDEEVKTSSTNQEPSVRLFTEEEHAMADRRSAEWEERFETIDVRIVHVGNQEEGEDIEDEEDHALVTSYGEYEWCSKHDTRYHLQENYQKVEKEELEVEERSNEERALDMHDDTYKKMDHDVWIGDSGASSHMTNSLEGMIDLRNIKSYVTFGDSKRLEVTKIGTKQGIVIQKNGTVRNIEIKNVKYVPDMYCNLFSITSAMKQGFTLIGNKNSLTMKKKNYCVNFDRIIKSGQGFLFGIKIAQGSSNVIRRSGTSEKIAKKKTLSRSEAHKIFGHCDDRMTEASARKYGYVLYGGYEPCHHCLKAKVRQKNISKVPRERRKRKGELTFWDISSTRYKSVGGTKFWNLIVDDCTNMMFSIFLKSKSDLPKKGIQFIKRIKNKYGVDMETIRCDNAGENRKLEERIDEENLGPTMEYTATGTPQQNGRAERGFATLYGRVRAMFNEAGIDGDIKNKLWAEAANMATQTNNILVKNPNMKTAYEKFTNKKPRYAMQEMFFDYIIRRLDVSSHLETCVG